MNGQLPSSPAAERNKQPILGVLESILPASGSVLELASGTGQHMCHFASHLPAVRFQPTEPDADACAVIAARIREAALTNVTDPVVLDVHETRWPVADSYDVVVCINMIHISPWSATDALCRGAARHLRGDGRLMLYGPYLEHGTAVQSNLDFDAWLKRRNVEWGLRDLADVTRVAASYGLRLERVERLPANNLALVFARPG